MFNEATNNDDSLSATTDIRKHALRLRGWEKNGERLFEVEPLVAERRKICRGFSCAGVKSYDNRSVKRVQGYFIITDCT